MIVKLIIFLFYVKFSQSEYRLGLWRTRENEYNSKRDLDSYENIYHSQNYRNDWNSDISNEKKESFGDFESQYRRDFTNQKYRNSYQNNNRRFQNQQYTTTTSYDLKNNFGSEENDYGQFRTTRKYFSDNFNKNKESEIEKIFFHSNNQNGYENQYNSIKQSTPSYENDQNRRNSNNGYNSIRPAGSSYVNEVDGNQYNNIKQSNSNNEDDQNRRNNNNNNNYNSITPEYNRKENSYVNEVNEYSNSVFQNNNNNNKNNNYNNNNNNYNNNNNNSNNNRRDINKDSKQQTVQVSDNERNENKREFERPHQGSSDSKNNDGNLLSNDKKKQNGGNNGGQGGSKRNLIPEKKCGLDVPRRIIGGTQTDIDEFPWMGLLQYVDNSGNVSHDCSGVLISKRYVLTAAHCTNGAGMKKREIKLEKVRLGEWDVTTEKDCQGDVCSPKTQEIDIEDIIPHEGYKPKDKSQVNDIALIRLKNEANLNQFVQPICLPFDKIGNTDYEGKKLTVSGWGKTSNARNSASNIKMKVDLPVVNWERCRQFYKSFYGDVQIKESQFCAGGEEGQDSCRGDSGGPLMTIEKSQNEIKWYVIGVVSSGPAACGMQDRPSLYTNVSQFTDWILDNIKS